MATQCQALYISDETRCSDDATHANGLFCHYHARQAYALYKGYKRRNAALDHSLENKPLLLATDGLRSEFKGVKNEAHLKETIEYLYRCHALTDRVIRARKLHHSRFYALELDYGHQKYLDNLASQKHSLTRAIERAERRIAEVLYEKQQWFEWVRELEDEEESARDAEKKKIKQEAALLSRHIKEMQARLAIQRQKENELREQEYLDRAHAERQRSEDETDDEDEDWDPIEDSLEDERQMYINLLQHFLWTLPPTPDPVQDTTEPAQAPQEVVPDEPESAGAAASKSKNAKKKARQKANRDAKAAAEGPKPGQKHVESESEVRQRLHVGEYLGPHAGVPIEYGDIIEGPIVKTGRMPSIPEEELETLISQIKEIKELLLCRLLLSHAVLLPAALKAGSIEEFLADTRVTNPDLRDLCLKIEQPSPQQLRDACADLYRDDGEADDAEAGVTELEQTDFERERTRLRPKTRLPVRYRTAREKKLQQRKSQVDPSKGAIVDFGDIDDAGQYEMKKIRVKVCGRYIYNYPSAKAMPRGGWIQFCIMATNQSVFDAMRLCRNWEESFELSVLSIFNYFPSGSWSGLVQQRESQALVLMVSTLWTRYVLVLGHH